jgi:hypothetical protein
MQFDLSPIARLVDTKYEKEIALRAAGISSFIPALRFQESLARSSEELSEYRSFVALACRNNIVNDKAFSQQLVTLKQEMTERNRASGNYWDLVPTEMERRYWQEAIQRSDLMAERKHPFEVEMKRLFETELLSFNHGYTSKFGKQAQERSIAKNIYLDLVVPTMSEIGFRLNKKEKSKEHVDLVKSITPHLDLHLLMDLPNLLQRAGEPKKNLATGQWLPPSGPSLVTWLQLHDSASNHVLTRIMLDWLLPIREFPLGTNWCCRFYEMDELESLVNMQLVMYRIVIADIEQAVKHG